MKRIFLSLALIFATTFGALAITPSLAFADTASSKNQVCEGLGEVVSGADCSKAGSSGLKNLITNILNVFSAIIGVVAVFMVVFGGFRYITSAGDSSKVTSAKNTIIYAIIGLVIVAFAQIIVKFVIQKATSAPNTSQQQQQNN